MGVKTRGTLFPANPGEGVPLEGTMSVRPHTTCLTGGVAQCRDGEPGCSTRLPDWPKFRSPGSEAQSDHRGEQPIRQRLSAPQLHGADFPDILRPRFWEFRSGSIELFELQSQWEQKNRSVSPFPGLVAYVKATTGRWRMLIASFA